MEISVSIGPDDDERSVSVTIGAEDGWSPDQMTDVANRGVIAAVSAWRSIHPVEVAT